MREDEQSRSWYGYLYDHKGFTEQREEWFRSMAVNARPNDWKALDIMSIVYEELEPYFAGQRGAKEAAEILDNRVQLFLDERTRK